MKLGIHQPNFLPWVPFFLKMELADHFINLNHVEYSKGGWTNRCQLNGKFQSPSYLTLPVKKSDTSLPINQVRVGGNAKNILYKMKKTVVQNLGSSSGKDFIEQIFLAIETTINHSQSLETINMAIISCIRDILEIKTPIYDSSMIPNLDKFKKGDLVVELCRLNEATAYITGTGSQNYLEFFPNNLDLILLKTDDVATSALNILDFLSCYGKDSPAKFKDLSLELQEKLGG